MAVKNSKLHLDGDLGGNVGLDIFGGPKWEEDTLNDINETSMLLNAIDMFDKCRFYSSRIRNEKKWLPNIKINQGG